MSASSAWADSDTSSPLADATCDERSVIVFKGCQAGVEQFAFGDDDDVKAMGDLVTTENLSYQSFSPVSYNSSAELFRSCDAQTSNRALIGKDEYRGEAPGKACAPLVDFLKLGAAPDTLVRPEPGQVTRC